MILLTMDGSTEFRDQDEFSYKIDYGPSKDKMFYILMFYVSAMIIGIILVAWKLRGYNRPDMGLRQALVVANSQDEVNAQPVVITPITGTRRRRNVAERIQQNAEGDRRRQNNGDVRGKNEEDVEENQPSEKIGAKKLRKLQEKEEKRKMREMMEMERVDRKKKQEEREEARELDEQKQLEIEKEKEEEERKIKEQKEKEEHEKYLELKKSFEVDEEGQEEVTTPDEDNSKLQEFIDYLKDTKVVLMEDLASHFDLRTKDAIDRVQDLLKQEVITGVMNDRGKFIYISREELESVAKFVKQRGRVAISELAAASNSLINLQQASTI